MGNFLFDIEVQLLELVIVIIAAIMIYLAAKALKNLASYYFPDGEIEAKVLKYSCIFLICVGILAILFCKPLAKSIVGASLTESSSSLERLIDDL